MTKNLALIWPVQKECIKRSWIVQFNTHVKCGQFSILLLCFTQKITQVWMSLKQKLLYHFSMYPTVGLVSTVFDVGGIFGGPLLGYVTDRSRHGPLNAIFKTSTNHRFWHFGATTRINFATFKIVFSKIVYGSWNCLLSRSEKYHLSQWMDIAILHQYCRKRLQLSTYWLIFLSRL